MWILSRQVTRPRPAITTRAETSVGTQYPSPRHERGWHARCTQPDLMTSSGGRPGNQRPPTSTSSNKLPHPAATPNKRSFDNKSAQARTYPLTSQSPPCEAHAAHQQTHNRNNTHNTHTRTRTPCLAQLATPRRGRPSRRRPTDRYARRSPPSAPECCWPTRGQSRSGRHREPRPAASGRSHTARCPPASYRSSRCRGEDGQ